MGVCYGGNWSKLFGGWLECKLPDSTGLLHTEALLRSQSPALGISVGKFYLSLDNLLTNSF